jgi:hypothetical protein
MPSVRKRQQYVALAHVNSVSSWYRDVEIPETVPLLIDEDFGQQIGVARLRPKNDKIYAILESKMHAPELGRMPVVRLAVVGGKRTTVDGVVYFDGGEVVAASVKGNK